MSDPFLIRGPAVISFSGGRTSAYMLWRILQAHGDRLPHDVLVCFQNTGREMPATLDFVQECAARWAVNVTWLEFTVAAPGFEVVSHNSASRGGEPYAALIRHRGVLPNAVARFCTVDLKIRPMFRWLDAMGWPQDTRRVLGFRADEPHRVERALDPERQKKGGREARNQVFPLYDAGIVELDVKRFWAAQPFDLRLRGSWEGNCDGCFLKRRSAIVRMWREHPHRMQWWANQEQSAAERIGAGGGALFREGWRGGYAGIARDAADNPMLPGLSDDAEVFDPMVACGGGCGV